MSITVTLTTEEVQWLEKNLKNRLSRKARKNREQMLQKLLRGETTKLNSTTFKKPHGLTNRLRFGTLSYEVLDAYNDSVDGLTRNNAAAICASDENRASALSTTSAHLKRGYLRVARRENGKSIYEITPKGRNVLVECKKRHEASTSAKTVR